MIDGREKLWINSKDEKIDGDAWHCYFGGRTAFALNHQQHRQFCFIFIAVNMSL